MSALSPPPAIDKAKNKGAWPLKGARARGPLHGRSRARAARRDFAAHWFAPLAIVCALSLAHMLGLFASVDGRFFDGVTVNQPAAAPSVVIIERDARFENQTAERFSALEAGLAKQGIERVGYLGADRGMVLSSKLPVVIGLSARALPQNESWELNSTGELGEGVPAARTLAPAQYGINRVQLSALEGRSQPIAVFDAALANRTLEKPEFLVPMSARQSIPVLKASQLVAGDIKSGELSGLVAMVVMPEALRGSLNTPLDPSNSATSEAVFRAHSVHALKTGQISQQLSALPIFALLFGLGLALALLLRRTDPKQIALVIPLGFSVLIAAVCWAAIIYGGKLLPVAALMAAPWIITFQRIIARETVQDRRLERTASRAVQTSFSRSPLREGARLPQFLGSAAQYAGVERSLLIELKPNGVLEPVSANNASIDDIALSAKELRPILKGLRETFAVRNASDIVPSWEGDALIGWIGTPEQQLFWLHTRPDTETPGQSAHLVRAIVTSFRELFRSRADLNSRSGQDHRHLPIDDKVASAIALVGSESEQIRRGFDTIDTAVVIFHLIGSPLHANEAMQELYREAGLSLFDTSLSEALLALTELDGKRVKALIEDLMLNGAEMRMPMRDLGQNERPSQRMLRIAAPARNAHGSDRILVLEAIDMRDVNRAADLRKAVAKFIDLQLRNDFEAILLGSQLATDDRLASDQLRGVVARIGETARRATGRLDEVASLVRSETSDLTEACYPVDATAVVKDAIARASTLADELGVAIEADHPGVSGFTLAEPVALCDMLVAMLRVVIADTPHGGVVKLRLEELKGRTHIRISGGFGIGFDRLLWLIANYEDGAVGEYRQIGEGMAKVTRWSASVSYWGSEANGFGFNIDLRGVG